MRPEVQAVLNLEVPVIVGGEEIRTGNTAKMVMPHDHGHVLGTFHQAGEAEVKKAIEAASAAKHSCWWSGTG